jgi:ring-1,2-phenylacetyl-CoA epoxidase subunit PaaB
MESLDPRINRLDLQKTASKDPVVKERELWPTFEVFIQPKRGKQHQHAGSVHASDPEMALVLAKEQFGRRLAVVNMWVVKTADIYAFNYEDEDMFATIPDKSYREASGYKTREKIEAYKKKKRAENQ